MIHSFFEIYNLLCEAIDKNEKHFTLPNGSRIKISFNLKTIGKLGVSCIKCKTTGNKWIETVVKQTEKTTFSTLNLYDSDGVMITVDHITPKHHGGTDSLNNLVIMCSKCNNKKGSNFDRH